MKRFFRTQTCASPPNLCSRGRPTVLLQLLRRQALRHKHAAYRSSLPDRLDGLIRRRVIPSKSFLGAVERDHHDALWRLALENLSLAATPDIVEAPTERRQRFRNLFRVLLKGGAVGYLGFRDEISGRRFGLLRVNRHDAHCPDRNACQHRQRQLAVLIHLLALLLWVCPHSHRIS